MMKYFIDTEFLEGTQDKTILGIKYGNSKPTIDLISIGIVSEDGREFYAISKEFNLKEAWNRYQIRKPSGGERVVYPDGVKEYWIRENILRPIWNELRFIEDKDERAYLKSVQKNIMFGKEQQYTYGEAVDMFKEKKFCYRDLKYLINKHGKTNKQIAEEVKEFVYKGNWKERDVLPNEDVPGINNKIIEVNLNPIYEFYGYYADYDWVVFCWLFGKMIDLPKGFPMYCNDLKQLLDIKVENLLFSRRKEFDIVDVADREGNFIKEYTLKEKLSKIKQHHSYPKQTNEHNALNDARWNRDLYKFIEKL